MAKTAKHLIRQTITVARHKTPRVRTELAMFVPVRRHGRREVVRLTPQVVQRARRFLLIRPISLIWFRAKPDIIKTATAAPSVRRGINATALTKPNVRAGVMLLRERAPVRNVSRDNIVRQEQVHVYSAPREPMRLPVRPAVQNAVRELIPPSDLRAVPAARPANTVPPGLLTAIPALRGLILMPEQVLALPARPGVIHQPGQVLAARAMPGHTQARGRQAVQIVRAGRKLTMTSPAAFPQPVQRTALLLG